MTTTTYYDLNIVEGTDIVNPLIVDNPNYEKIDEAMHDNAVSGVTLATEIANATVHAITRENSECAVIRFIATSNWKAGDTVTVDGVPVTALLPSGETLPDGAYVINANVLCILTGTNLTVYAERKKIDNATEIAYNNTTVAAELNKLNSNLEGEFVSLGNGNGGYKKVGNIVTVNSYFIVGETPGVYVLATNLPMPIEIAVLNVIEHAHGTSLTTFINKNGELIVLEPTTYTINRIYITGSYICV